MEVVRVNASHALIRVDAPLALTGPALRKALRQDESDEVRAHAALALGHRAQELDGENLEALRKALSDPHGEVRAAAVWGLAERPDIGKRVRDAIAALANDETPDVRIAVQAALERIDQAD